MLSGTLTELFAEVAASKRRFKNPGAARLLPASFYSPPFAVQLLPAARTDAASQRYTEYCGITSLSLVRQSSRQCLKADLTSASSYLDSRDKSERSRGGRRRPRAAASSLKLCGWPPPPPRRCSRTSSISACHYSFAHMRCSGTA